MISSRGSGILLHISSLPGKYGIGDFGINARKFVDFLIETKTKYWQVLPLNPTEEGLGNSPYSSSSAFALNPLFIDPDDLVERKLLEKAEVIEVERAGNSVDYSEAYNYKYRLLDKAYQAYRQHTKNEAFTIFCQKNKFWLNDFALFRAIKQHYENREWFKWPEAIRDRDKEALMTIGKKLEDQIEKEKFIQFLAHEQWMTLKEYCNDNGIQLIGDIPIYIQHDSADVWANPRYFKLDENKKPTHVSGVPPDYFSETGQLWGTPVYNWEKLKEDNYLWWIRRLQNNFKLFDVVRIDHFRGLVGYWEVEANEETAINGRWVDVRIWDFYYALNRKFPALPVIAEDLGEITPDVREFILKTNFPGMRILQFGFQSMDPEYPFLPHNYDMNCVAYTGTHDNSTLIGWYETEIGDEERDWLNKYLGRKIDRENVSFELIRTLLQSRAGTAIFQMQDLLGLGVDGRMNTPSTASGNWTFSFTWSQIKDHMKYFLKDMNELYGR